MCNLYKARTSLAEMARIFSAEDRVAAFDGETELYPKSLAPVVRNADGGRVIELMRWGFPIWRPHKRDASKTVTEYWTNARNLTASLWRSGDVGRCLVPVTQFAEPDASRGKGGCAWFGMNDDTPFAFAGLWKPTRDGNHFAFLTCDANPIVAPVHPKAMPVILQPEDYGRWLAGDRAIDFQQPFPSQLMRMLP